MIEDMNKRFETTTLKNPSDEKKLLAEIAKLKASIPQAERLAEIKPVLDSLYDQRKAVNEKVSAIKDKIEAQETEVEAIRKELEEAKGLRDDVKQQIEKIDEDIAKTKEELSKVYARKDELREDYFKAKLEFEIELEEIRHVE